jgi:acyl-CoA thioesterase-1
MSGADTSDVLSEQLNAAIKVKPTLVTVGIGINDIGHGVTIEKFARNYEEIVSQLKNRTHARIVVTNLPDVSLAPAAPAYLRATVRQMVLLFNQKIEEIARRENLFMVDAYAATHDSLASMPALFSADGFHPSDAGYEKWAEVMLPTVEKAISD